MRACNNLTFLGMYKLNCLLIQIYISFTGLATQTEVTLNDIKEVEITIRRFSRYYEREFYQGKWDRSVIQPANLGIEWD